MTSTSDRLDPAIRPQDDFFGHANGRWLREHPIPATESRWGTFDVLADQAWSNLRIIVDEIGIAPEASLDHPDRLLQQFFAAAMGFDEHQAANWQTFDTLLADIDAIDSPQALCRFVGQAHRQSINVLWSVFDDLDDKNSRLQVLRWVQGGLLLPNRDYYLDDSPRMHEVRAAYDQHFTALQGLMRGRLDSTDWQAVQQVEMALATAAWPDVELRDPESNYHRTSRAQLQADYPHLDFAAYYQGLGWQQPNDCLVVNQPSFFAAVDRLVAETPLAVIQHYLRWYITVSCAGLLSAELSEALFGFFGTALQGATEQKPLWKRTIINANNLVVGEALGRSYVQRHFPESSKQAVLSLVEDIRSAYAGRIGRLEWMSQPTREAALAKLKNISIKIGYPDQWRDFAGLSLSPTAALANRLTLAAYETDEDLARIGQPPAAEHWHMFPQVVNAYHDPNRLEIVFPAAILQPPFYDPTASYAANLGGIGSVIGHEFTHGFDDQGRQFDATGTLRPWSTAEETAAFEQRAQLIADQADAYLAAPGVHLQGGLVLGEAIADLGGLELAVAALTAHGKVDEATLRELFIAFAITECGATREESRVRLAKTDPHPPARFRVNATVSHVDSFYDIYQLKEGDALYRPSAERAKIW